jgi:hypothetical protein
MTDSVRRELQEVVTPLVHGAGPLRSELEVRFTRALTLCTVLADVSARGIVPTVATVAEVVAAGY